MLKYLVILLDDTSTSFCHYNNGKTVHRLIDYEVLESAIQWAMKENVMVQFVYPKYSLPDKYRKLIDTIDHVDIAENDPDADISIINGFDSLAELNPPNESSIVLRITSTSFFENADKLLDFPFITIVFTDVEKWTNDTLEKYSSVLNKLSDKIFSRISSGKPSKINLVTDRMQLKSMNNCGSGEESLTLAPDGLFYICPAFYLNGDVPVGSPRTGIAIPNSQLYRISHAPICRKCDAYNCKRCVWLNKVMTHEVNTPSRQQCVMSHIERNASRQLLERLKSIGIATSASIPEINYLDPFETLLK